MLGYIEYLGIPLSAAIIIVAAFFLMQLIGELLEFKGKIVPELFKVRKFFARKKAEREETAKTLSEVKQLLSDVNERYSADNINKRNSWMQWVDDRAKVYDESIKIITGNLEAVTNALKDNTNVTEELFVQSSRDRIIDFATTVADDDTIASRESFRRIFKVYKKYEKFLEEHGMTNGEVDAAYRIINEAYETRMRSHSFLEDTRGYTR